MEYYIKKLLDYIGESREGFYIECGANDGITESYTYELEKLGWKGILIEPSEKAFNKCKTNRSLNNYFFCCALISSNYITEIEGDFNGDTMSSINGKRLNREIKVRVPARTLDSILEEVNINHIDLFSLDVEGYELEVLKGFNLQRYHPRYIIIEIYNNIKDDILQMMLKNNYDIVDNLTGYNRNDNPLWDGLHNDYLFEYLRSKSLSF